MKWSGNLNTLDRLPPTLAALMVIVQVSLAQPEMVPGSKQMAGMNSFLTQSKSSFPGVQRSFLDSAEAEWVKYYSSSGLKGNANGNAVSVDPQGNIYVAGKAEDPFTSYDYLTVKYNSMGVELWSARYDGSAHGVDIANAIAVDPAGNVYVTGVSAGGETGYDYATVKYNSSGQVRWVARYNGAGNWNDAAIGLAIDGDGNVFVIGESRGQNFPNCFDFATIKYDSLGVEQWVNRYDGLAHVDDQPVGVGLDGSGNVYIVGTSCDSLYTYFSAAIVKYSSSGIQQWIVRYMPADTISAFPLDFAVDDSGNVVITGYTANAQGYWWSNPTKCFTMKCNAAGALQWSSLYEGVPNSRTRGTHTVVDPTGNVYVSGVIEAGPNSFISKYDPSGQLQWTSWINLNLPDIALDPTGSVFITTLTSSTYYPNELVTIRYSPTGQEEWRSTYTAQYNNRLTATALVSDAIGNLYIVGGTGGDQGSDMLMLKYNASGVRKWVKTKECTRSWDQVYAIAVDDSNNVYVTGTSGTGAWASDILTIKYGTARGPEWIARYSGSLMSRNVPCALKVDELGNVYILATGDSMDWGNGGSLNQFITLKYNSSGQQLWAARYFGPDRYSKPYAVDMGLDRSGNVYVTGFVYGGDATIKYSSSGVTQWVARFDTVNTTWIFGPRAIAVDDSNNVIVAGTDYIVKYDGGGSFLWRYEGGALALAVDQLGNIFTTSESGGTKKLNSSGIQEWSVNFGGNAITVDPAGYVLVRNYFGGVTRISVAGLQLWSLPYDNCMGKYLAVDRNGNTYTAGYTFSSEYRVRAIDPSGIQKWSTGFEDSGVTQAYQYPIVVSNLGDVYVGAVAQAGASSVYKTIKYRQVATSVKEKSGEVPVTCSLSQNYPNPFNPMTEIRFEVGGSGFVSLTVYDVLGREVATLVNENIAAGTYSAQWNASTVASGVYFYRLKAGEYVETRKLLLLR